MQPRHALSEEEIKLLGKFGFQVDDTSVYHKKMDIEKKVEDFQGFTSLSELEDYIKGLLRTS